MMWNHILASIVWTHAINFVWKVLTWLGTDFFFFFFFKFVLKTLSQNWSLFLYTCIIYSLQFNAHDDCRCICLLPYICIFPIKMSYSFQLPRIKYAAVWRAYIESLLKLPEFFLHWNKCLDHMSPINTY